METFLSRGRNETAPDQWQSQILLRILMKARVIYVSEVKDTIVEDMHMIPAHSLKEALNKAREILGKENITINAIPDGVSVIAKKI
jgi:nickel-dependent lactate racemase